MSKSPVELIVRLAGCLLMAGATANAWAQTNLADQPLSTSKAKLANIALTPSVEFPTAISNAHPDIYFNPSKIYVGYFDPYKCYKYNTTPASAARYFTPVADVANKLLPQCSGAWSGNLLNYATMQTIDIFRWAMTGGSRWVEGSVNYDRPYDSSDNTASLVVLRRAYHNTQGQSNNFYVKVLRNTVTGGISAYVDTSSLSGLSTSQTLGFTSRPRNSGTALGSTFRVANLNNSSPDREPNNFPTTYVQFNAAAEVCKFNASLLNNGLEPNCTKYKSLAGLVSYKPEGLMQQYKKDFRFSVFAYYNRSYQNGSSGAPQDGAPMRAPMKFIDVELTDMGAYIKNPDTTVAAASGVANSGAMNYLNLFGFESQTYKHYDNVSEMYAEAIRYFRGESAPSATTIVASPSQFELDYFPAVNTWSNWPAIKNWCDQNFIVGIGDVNTHADRHIYAGPSPSSSWEPSTASINAGVDAVAWTKAVGDAEGMSGLESRRNINGNGTGYDFNAGSTITPSSCCNDNGFYMAGLAYFANTNDVNPNIKNTQTVQTYWVDVLEYGVYKHKNQYWLAAKYGGFVDSTAAATAAGGRPMNKNGDKPDLNSEWWANCRALISTGSCTGSYPLPDNYFVAADAAQMVASLSSTFQNIKASVSSTAGSTGSTNVFQNYGTTDLVKTQYDSSDWSGDVIKYSVSGFNATTGQANTTTVWNARTVMNTQFAGTGWDQGRRIVTMGLKAVVAGVEQFEPKPFRLANLSPTQVATLGPTSTVQQEVLNYIRGDKSKEGNPYRKRAYLLGDIVTSLAVIVGAPNAAYSDGYNPGYGAFKQNKSARPEVIYFGANDGMMHAINSADGKELFAYVPRAVYEGSFEENVGVDETDGIAALANANYGHKYYVNATPVVRDIDFARAGDLNWKQSATPDWHTILIGGLGKGGKSYYAIDVTDPPTSSDTETTIARKVLWEFTLPDLGYSYGEPLIIKSERWGWVVVFTSGYNNASGVGTIFVVNPKTGALITSAQTASGSSTKPAGLTEATGFARSYQDWTYKELYAGDLDGNVWRFDLPVNQSVASGPTTITVSKIAVLTDGLNPQPITVPPWVDVAESGRRYVFVGTGRALDNADVTGTTGVNVQRQTIYAIPDGDSKQPYTTTTRPTSGGAPYRRTDLTSKTITDLTSTSAVCSSAGWYFDLPDGGTTTGTERIIRNMKGTSNSWLMVISDVPSSDPCDSSGWYSWLYLLTMDCAQSQLGTTSSPVARLGGSGKQILAANLIVSNGSHLLIETPSGQIKTSTRGKHSPAKVINWRVIGQ